MACREANEFRVGDFRLHIVSDGTFRLDGGAMFGVVPRVLWERVSPPDEKNRIQLGLNTLLVRTGRETVLIDTGIGDKWDSRTRMIYGIDHHSSLPESLSRAGAAPEDIDIVINTHLHFDHCGWNTRTHMGQVVPTFPRARYAVQRGEYEHANDPHERDRASYRPENWAGLDETGRLDLIEGDREIVEGIQVKRLPGHNQDFQCVFIYSRGETAVFWSDLIPMTPHVQFPWIMAYDLFPEETLRHKKELIPRAAREGWLCVFHHDPAIPVGKIIEEGGKYMVRPALAATA